MQNDSPRPGLPAKLPAHSRAAAAQRLDEHPQSMRGVYYPVPHRSVPPRRLVQLLEVDELGGGHRIGRLRPNGERQHGIAGPRRI